MLNVHRSDRLSAADFSLRLKAVQTAVATAELGNSNTEKTRFLGRSQRIGTGLKAEYFQGQKFNTLKVTRVDPTVNFNWAAGSPNLAIANNNFSVRWTGKVQPKYSERYTFHLASDDGVKLWVNKRLLVNRWTTSGKTAASGTINLRGGKQYSIKLEYREKSGKANAKLLWSSSRQRKQIIPRRFLYAGFIAPSDPDQTGGNPTPIDPTPINNSPDPTDNPFQNAIATSVDWSTVAGNVSRLGYGINAYQGFRTSSFNNVTYHGNLTYMAPGIIRFHHAGAMNDSSTTDGLIDTANQTWDAAKIKNGLSASIAAFGNNQPQRMLNIPTWPAWMDANNDGFLDENQYDNYADLCADLVQITNKDNSFNIKYWEITNEKDDHYFTQFHTLDGWGSLKDPAQPDRLNDLITIYNKVAVAMKQVDPTIQVGGPGIARSDLQPFYKPFIQGTVNNLDFFTYHFYSTGSAATSDQDIYNSTRSIGTRTARMVQTLKEASPNREIPVMLGEYNISWTWQTYDPRMTNHKGVVFDALSVVEALKNGAVSTLAWNEKDDIYGKMDNQYHLRPGAKFLHLMNQYLVGDRVEVSSSNEAITTYAVSNSQLGYKSYLVINRSGTSQPIKTQFNGWVPTGQTVQHEISASGYSQTTVNWNEISQGVFIPADAVMLLTFAP